VFLLIGSRSAGLNTRWLESKILRSISPFAAPVELGTHGPPRPVAPLVGTERIPDVIHLRQQPVVEPIPLRRAVWIGNAVLHFQWIAGQIVELVRLEEVDGQLIAAVSCAADWVELTPVIVIDGETVEAN